MNMMKKYDFNLNLEILLQHIASGGISYASSRVSHDESSLDLIVSISNNVESYDFTKLAVKELIKSTVNDVNDEDVAHFINDYRMIVDDIALEYRK